MLSKTIKPCRAARKLFCLGTCAVILSQTLPAVGAEAGSLTHFVDPFIGTAPSPGSQFGVAFDTGNVFPGAVAPRGMLAWSPDTTSANKIAGGYWYPDSAIEGFSLTHFSGRGVCCLKDIPFLPVVVPVTNSPGTNFSQFAAAFSHKNETASPGFYQVRLDNGIETALASSSRAGVARFVFPANSPAGLLIRADGAVAINGREVSGFHDTHIDGGKRSKPPYKLYFVAELDQPFTSRVWLGNELKNAASTRGNNCGAILNFDLAKNRTVNVRVGISYVSIENARANFAAEIPNWNFDAVRQQTEADWNRALGRIEVEGGSTAEKRVLYTALYHCFIHPNILDDVNGQYPGMDEKIHQLAPGHHQYQNIPAWDHYRSHAPLTAILTQHDSSDMMQSLVNYAQQDASVRANGGGLPRWQQVNHNSGGMVGDGDLMILASAYAFGANQFDVQGALTAMNKNASVPGTTSDGFEVRQGLNEFLSLGYVPRAVSVTLEYCTADFALAQFAKALGDAEKYSLHLQRARNWTNTFDNAHGWVRPRAADGSWLDDSGMGAVTDMKQFYVESSREQAGWMINFDLPGLIQKIGGKEKTVARLDQFFTQLNSGMRSEFAYMGNEPGEGIPWIYDFAGAPAKAQKVVHRIQDELFTDQPGGLPGNDDAGSISSWYVFSALGFFPEIPGVAGFALGSPMFAKATLHLDNEVKVEIIGHNASPENYYVRELDVNGEKWESPWLPWPVISGGGTIRFDLQNKATAWGTDPSQAPPAFFPSKP
jgi:predicted alpha-1,2-mannosidase